MEEKQFSKEIKKFQCDGVGEFIKIDFIKILKVCGIVRIFHANLHLYLQVKCFLTVVFHINRLSSLVLKMVTLLVSYMKGNLITIA